MERVIIALAIVFSICGIVYAVDTEFGEFGHSDESAGFDAVIDLNPGGTWMPFINASAGDLNGFTFTSDDTNGDYLTVPSDGNFLISMTVCAINNKATATNLHCALHVDGTADHSIMTETVLAGGAGSGDAGNGTGIRNLNANDVLRIKCQTPSGQNNREVIIEHLNLSAVNLRDVRGVGTLH
jgi:hypothetical protein